MENVKKTESVIVSRRAYRVTYYPKKWYNWSNLAISQLKVKSSKKFICWLKWGSSNLQSAYASNTRLLDIIYKMNLTIIADMELNKLFKKLK